MDLSSTLIYYILFGLSVLCGNAVAFMGSVLERSDAFEGVTLQSLANLISSASSAEPHSCWCGTIDISCPLVMPQSLLHDSLGNGCGTNMKLCCLQRITKLDASDSIFKNVDKITTENQLKVFLKAMVESLAPKVVPGQDMKDSPKDSSVMPGVTNPSQLAALFSDLFPAKTANATSSHASKVTNPPASTLKPFDILDFISQVYSMWNRQPSVPTTVPQSASLSSIPSVPFFDSNPQPTSVFGFPTSESLGFPWNALEKVLETGMYVSVIGVLAYTGTILIGGFTTGVFSTCALCYGVELLEFMNIV